MTNFKPGASFHEDLTASQQQALKQSVPLTSPSQRSKMGLQDSYKEICSNADAITQSSMHTSQIISTEQSCCRCGKNMGMTNSLNFSVSQVQKTEDQDCQQLLYKIETIRQKVINGQMSNYEAKQLLQKLQ
ncbi:Hypothetical_protein [Hexamita inflata]|uniref:Hypothetical_protein n=1 Tax=Hexamita inflata TaxID=28002 RepID=A0AA86NEC9_9EUKA|nr:Hypothetical protein HINF_LOCUS5907 [Hexamita inflata]